MQTWLAAAEISAGPVFREVSQSGRVAEAALRRDGYARAIKRRAAAAGLDPAGFSRHSLRSGFLTSAGEHGAALLKMKEDAGKRSGLREQRELDRHWVRRARVPASGHGLGHAGGAIRLLAAEAVSQ